MFLILQFRIIVYIPIKKSSAILLNKFFYALMFFIFEKNIYSKV